MAGAPTVLSLIASSIYGLVVVACLFAAQAARRERQLPGHWRTWALIAVLFVVLSVLRFYSVEELVRDSLRATFRAEGAYRDRRTYQAPLVAFIFVIIGVFAFALLYRWSRIVRGRRNVARIVAVVASCGMLFLMLLRLASLHIIDGLLYGALKLNWVLDLGFSVTVIAAAITYVRLVRRPG